MDADILPRAALTAGWIGQACFFARFLVQWLASERARRPVVPPAFWQLSLAGSLLATAYALQTGAHVLVFGFAVTAAIAARNLQIGTSTRRIGPGAAGILAVLLALVLLALELAPGNGAGESRAWLAVGVIGQCLWSARFPLQWWSSERAGRSQFPVSFWWLSLAGNLLLLAYALHLGDAVFVLGFSIGPLVQVRNLALAARARLA